MYKPIPQITNNLYTVIRSIPDIADVFAPNRLERAFVPLSDPRAVMDASQYPHGFLHFDSATEPEFTQTKTFEYTIYVDFACVVYVSQVEDVIVADPNSDRLGVLDVMGKVSDRFKGNAKHRQLDENTDGSWRTQRVNLGGVFVPNYSYLRNLLSPVLPISNFLQARAVRIGIAVWERN